MREVAWWRGLVCFLLIVLPAHAYSSSGKPTGFVLDLGMSQAEINTSLEFLESYINAVSSDSEFMLVATGEVIRFMIPAMNVNQFRQELNEISAQLTALEYGNFAVGLERAIEAIGVRGSSGSLVLLSNGEINTSNPERVPRYYQWAQLVLIPDAAANSIDLSLVAPSVASTSLSVALQQETDRNKRFEQVSGDSIELVVASLYGGSVQPHTQAVPTDELVQSGGIENSLSEPVTDIALVSNAPEATVDPPVTAAMDSGESIVNTQTVVDSANTLLQSTESESLAVSEVESHVSETSQGLIDNAISVDQSRSGSSDVSPPVTTDSTVSTAAEEPGMSSWLIYLLAAAGASLVFAAGLFFVKRSRAASHQQSPPQRTKTQEIGSEPSSHTGTAQANELSWLRDMPTTTEQQETRAHSRRPVVGNAVAIAADSTPGPSAYPDDDATRVLGRAPEATVVVDRKSTVTSDESDASNPPVAMDPSVAEMVDPFSFDDDFAAFEESINFKKKQKPVGEE